MAAAASRSRAAAPGRAGAGGRRRPLVTALATLAAGCLHRSGSARRPGEPGPGAALAPERAPFWRAARSPPRRPQLLGGFRPPSAAGALPDGRCRGSDRQPPRLRAQRGSWEVRRDQMILPAARIQTPKGVTGSGFVLCQGANGTFVLTNHHVIRDAIQQSDRWDPVAKSSSKVERTQPISVQVFRYDDRGRHVQTVTTSAQIVGYTQYGDEWDFEGDLALLKLQVNLDDLPHSTLIGEQEFMDEVRTLDEIVMVGCPDGSELPLPTTGHIASLTEERAGVSLLLSQACSVERGLLHAPYWGLFLACAYRPAGHRHPLDGRQPWQHHRGHPWQFSAAGHTSACHPWLPAQCWFRGPRAGRGPVRRRRRRHLGRHGRR
ncbi:unnamed protein product [Prorocentrum cordatum]|uniref:Serine protease n=1 Tax=Prorocentrum cordatum TaxID=2364126 RepID=A0ABN9Q6E6_9DINO|nr:unnamed protein product [Polarella glacialis]